MKTRGARFYFFWKPGNPKKKLNKAAMPGACDPWFVHLRKKDTTRTGWPYPTPVVVSSWPSQEDELPKLNEVISLDSDGLMVVTGVPQKRWWTTHESLRGGLVHPSFLSGRLAPTKIPFITNVITHLLSGMNHQADVEVEVDDEVSFVKLFPNSLTKFRPQTHDGQHPGRDPAFFT